MTQLQKLSPLTFADGQSSALLGAVDANCTPEILNSFSKHDILEIACDSSAALKSVILSGCPEEPPKGESEDARCGLGYACHNVA